jgi:hypothetical protein
MRCVKGGKCHRRSIRLLSFDTWETLNQKPTCGLGLEALLNGGLRHSRIHQVVESGN